MWETVIWEMSVTPVCLSEDSQQPKLSLLPLHILPEIAFPLLFLTSVKTCPGLCQLLAEKSTVDQIPSTRRALYVYAGGYFTWLNYSSHYLGIQAHLNILFYTAFLPRSQMKTLQKSIFFSSSFSWLQKSLLTLICMCLIMSCSYMHPEWTLETQK